MVSLGRELHMVQVSGLSERRTSVDDIFDHLHEQILTLQLRPGDRISEAEIAANFGVSRQPVRDAFSRLANLDLLLIRPQRATEVRKFSMREIEKARFVRAAIDKEVLHRASEICDKTGEAKLNAALSEQEALLVSGDFEAFGQLDYAFHKLLCEIAQAEFAFDVIQEEKAKVDRLCMLGLAKERRMPELIDDHRMIAKAVISHDANAAVSAGLLHLSRLDETIETIIATNANYFENTDG